MATPDYSTLLSRVSCTSDFLQLTVLVLLALFALVFRFNTPLFGKMLGNVTVGKERQSIFETTANDSVLLNAFMLFQSVVLLAIFTFAGATELGYFAQPDVPTSIRAIAALSLCFLAFYLVSCGTFFYFGVIFTENAEYKLLLTNFQAIFGLFGISLYIPVLWVLLFERFFIVAFIILIISYLISRALLIYRFINFFFNENTRFLFFLLYLCTSEMTLLVLLIVGMINMYNKIWQ
jgi:hypothetical protein